MTERLFADLPQFPCALPHDELALLRKLVGCDWPTNQELDWSDRPAARRLAEKGLIRISRQKSDPVATDPDWYAGKLPAASIRGETDQ